MNTEMTDAIGPPPSPDEEPATPPPLPRMPLRRSTTDRMLGGVSGGLGLRYGIDPAVLRVVFVVGIFAGGVGLLAYLAMWLLIPDDTDTSSNPLTNSLWRLVLGVLVAMGGLAAVFGWLHSLGGFGGVIVGGSIVGLGVWLYSRNRSGPATSQPNTPTATPPTGFAYGGTGEPAASYQYDDSASTTYPVAAPKPARQRSYLGLITLLAMVMVAGLLGIAQVTGLISLSVVAFLSVLLTVLAIGLLVGAFVGRARWLIAPALVLALTIGAVAPIAPFITASVDAGVGERTWQPMSADIDYKLGLGNATLDLTKWASNPNAAAPELPDAIAAEVVLGELKVLVPADWQVSVAAHVQVGKLELNWIPVGDGAVDVEYNVVLPAQGEAAGQIILNLAVDAGQIAISQVAVPTVTGQPQADSGVRSSDPDAATDPSTRSTDPNSAADDPSARSTDPNSAADDSNGGTAHRADQKPATTNRDETSNQKENQQ